MPIRFDTVRPQDLNAVEWSELHSLYHQSFEEELRSTRSTDEINHLTSWNDFDRFHASHLDPNIEVSGRFNPNQSYHKPLVSLAVDGHDLIGFGYSADNVSGKILERQAKLLGMPPFNGKKYHWLREFVVHPDYKRNGVAKHMASILLMSPSRSALQPVTTYIWPNEPPFLTAPLVKAGFQPTGSKIVKVFGENSRPVSQVRMLAPTAASVVFKLF